MSFEMWFERRSFAYEARIATTYLIMPTCIGNVKLRIIYNDGESVNAKKNHLQGSIKWYWKQLNVLSQFEIRLKDRRLFMRTKTIIYIHTYIHTKINFDMEIE